MQFFLRCFVVCLAALMSSTVAMAKDYQSFEKAYKIASFVQCLSYTRDYVTLDNWRDETGFVQIDESQFETNDMPVQDAWKVNFKNGHLILLAHGEKSKACSTYIYSSDDIPTIELTEKYLSNGGLPSFLTFEQVGVDSEFGRETRSYKQIADKRIQATLTTVEKNPSKDVQLLAILTYFYGMPDDSAR